MPDWDTIISALREMGSGRPESLGEPPTLSLGEGEKLLIYCDLHTPYYDEPWVKRMLYIAREMGIKKSVAVGDTSNLDAVSRFTTLLAEPDVFADRDACNEWANLINAVVPENHVIGGNHDLRLIKAWAKMSKTPLSWERMASEFFPGMIAHPVPFGYMTIDGITRLTHPEKNYTQIQGRRAQRLANEVLHMNVACAGGHLYGLVADKSARYWAVDMPGLMDAKRVPYKALFDTLYPGWVNGFLVLEKFMGKHYPHVYADLITPPSVWPEELRG